MNQIELDISTYASSLLSTSPGKYSGKKHLQIPYSKQLLQVFEKKRTKASTKKLSVLPDAFFGFQNAKQNIAALFVLRKWYAEAFHAIFQMFMHCVQPTCREVEVTVGGAVVP